MRMILDERPPPIFNVNDVVRRVFIGDRIGLDGDSILRMVYYMHANTKNEISNQGDFVKFDCGETWEEEKARKEQWHDFFCIWPRQLWDHDCRWFEVIQRRSFYRVSWGDAGWEHQYREKPKS